MEILNEKINTIKKNYFNNIFNSSFIDDSYMFISNLPDEYFQNYSNAPIFKIIQELYILNHSNSYNQSTKNSSHTKATTISPSSNSNGTHEKYVQMIANFLQEKDKKNKENDELEKECQKALKKYYHEELFEFLSILNSSNLVKEKILSSKSDSFCNLLKFEESVIEFFNREVNDNTGYTKVKGSPLNFATRITGKTVTLRFEKEFEVSLLNLVSIIYEVNYYNKWYPFCHISQTVNQPGKAKKCVYMVVEIPIIKDRDFLVYGFGINRLRENGTILILCRGIEENSGIFEKEFKQTSNEKYVRGQILIFGFEIKVITPEKIVVRGLCNVNPKISFIPQSIINFVSEKFAQDMFLKFIKVARNYEGSDYQNKNPSKIDQEFYNFIQEEVKDIFKNKAENPKQIDEKNNI